MERKEWKFPAEERLREFPPGPWDDEPDKVQWSHEKTGLACMIRRGPMGNWCGYVGVDETHPYHGRGYHEVEEVLEVHGGLTYAAACDGDEDRGICHVPGPGEPEPLWWFGFDCGHAGDLIPTMKDDFPESVGPGGTPIIYRNQAFVTAEVESLALQLATVA